MEQLRLFPETFEEKMTREFKDVKSSCERVRKSQFAKIGEQTKIISTLRDDVDIIKKGLCESISFEKNSLEIYKDRIDELECQYSELRELVLYLKNEIIQNKNCEIYEMALN